MNLRERILSQAGRVPHVQAHGVAGRRARRRWSATTLLQHDGARVLDLGCGFGDYAPFYADRCDYLGIDHNESYIETARRMNAGSPARFVVADVADPVIRRPRSVRPRDHVGGVAPPVFRRGRGSWRLRSVRCSAALADSSRWIRCSTPTNDCLLAFAIASDRGRFARDEEGYRALFQHEFANVDTAILTGLLRIPYTHVVLTAIGMSARTAAQPDSSAGRAIDCSPV